MLRTHTCGQLRINDVGERTCLCGWVKTRRNHGNLIFIDLRDRYGITQLVFNPKHDSETYKKASSIKNEYVLRVEGEVTERPGGTKNKNIPTGEIEVHVNSVDILSISKIPPFDIEESLEVSEEARLTYRYLDLRNSQLQNNLATRYKTIKAIRDFLDSEEFLEIETPFLTKSTPEGARDYLVPSRLSRGKFYALPQSPQLFKQILMIAGVDKYFQIVRCFRDEDLRADRQPEFTQLDLEMSFIQEEDIYSLIERLLKNIFKKMFELNLKVPFPRFSYRKVIEKFGTEKPNLQQGDNFSFLWVDNFPLLKFNKEENRWESEHHPFTAPVEEDIPLLGQEPGKVRARAYDLILNGTEIASGSIRIHDKKLQNKILEIIGIDEKERKERFSFLLDALDFGAPPHGGIAFGLDRLIAILLNKDNIREVIAFPKTQKGMCLLTQAPSKIGKKQLDELGIEIKNINQD